MGRFVTAKQDNFSPEYGDIIWKRRLNDRLEANDMELEPIGYQEGKRPVMQVTQENTIIYINQAADELDCVAIMYDQDPADTWTWYWRDKFESDEMFATVITTIGHWATQIVTMYPLPHVVQQYEKYLDSEIPDEIPDNLV